MFTFNGAWTGVQTQSSFGHIYVGDTGSSMRFEFSGTRLALLSSNAYGKNFEVYIDGRKENSIALANKQEDFGASFISEVLADAKHSVEIRCVGKANIDSIVCYK